MGSFLLVIGDVSAAFAASTHDERRAMVFESRKWCNQSNVQESCMLRMFTTVIRKPSIGYTHIQRTLLPASRFVIQWLACGSFLALTLQRKRLPGGRVHVY